MKRVSLYVLWSGAPAIKYQINCLLHLRLYVGIPFVDMARRKLFRILVHTPMQALMHISMPASIIVNLEERWKDFYKPKNAKDLLDFIIDRFLAQLGIRG